MPLLLKCDDLEPGMRLSESIFRGRRLLLSAGKVLTHSDVENLCSKFPDVWARVGDPILDDAVEFESDAHDREVASTVQSKIANSMSKVGERFSSRMAVNSVDVRAVQHSVAEVMEYLKQNSVTYILLDRTLSAENYLSEHAGNVFYLSMMLGSAVREYVVTERERKTSSSWLGSQVAMDLMPLGLGAIFADLGMFPLKELFGSSKPLSDEDRRAILEHPNSGAEMLPADFSSTARAVVRSHHENFDGDGYPAGMKGERIHVFGRIVRIADAFDAATASHVYKEAKTSAKVLWEMSAGPFRRFYDPVLMKVFARLIQPFPIGAKLRLRDGRYAVVVRYNRQNPFLPTVVIAFDANDQRVDDSQLEGPLCLADRPDLRIESYGGEQLSYIYNQGAIEDYALSPSHFTTLFEAVFP